MALRRDPTHEKSFGKVKESRVCFVFDDVDGIVSVGGFLEL